MSVIRKQPFVEKVIKSLSADDLVTLKTLINTNTVNTVYSIDNMPSNNGVYAADFMIESGKIYSSFLIKNASYTVVIAYHKYQDLSMFNIVNNEIKRVNEYLNINELRRIVDDCLVEEGVIGSGDAGAGDVLTADGEGGTEWKNPADSITGDKLEAGAIVSVFGFNADGEPIKGEIPSGSVVDAELDEDSTNPVQNKVVTNEFDKKANKDGNYATLTAGLADNLTPYSDDSGALQEKPFISQGTGTNNNTEIVTVGDYGLLKSKNGNTIVVNNQLSEGDFATQTGWSTTSSATVTYSNGVATLTNCSSAGAGIRHSLASVIKNHKYLVIATLKSSVNTTSTQLSIYNGTSSADKSFSLTANVKKVVYEIINFNLDAGVTNRIYIYPESASGSIGSEATFEISNVCVIDLTQMFNSNIPADLLANPSHFNWYYNGSLTYNAGELVNANGRYLTSTGRQLWDEEWELGGYNNDGTKNNNTDVIRSKNKIDVIPNTSYYFCSLNTIPSSTYRIVFYDNENNCISSTGGITPNATFTTPNNARFMAFNLGGDYGTTYNHDITISLYYSPEQGGEGYNQYYPYEEPYVVDTGSEILRSAGSAYDVKVPDGTITRNVLNGDLSSFTFTYNSNNGLYESEDLASVIKIPTSGSVVANIVCDKYSCVKRDDATSINESISISGSGKICVKSSSSTITGTLYYELATPTTEQGTPYPTNLPINDYGMMYWDDDVPQGDSIFYPINYKGFLDDLYSRVNGDSSGYALESEMTASESERDTVDTQLKNAIGGTLRQCLCVKESLDFENTDFVDLGVLDYTKQGGVFYTNSLNGLIKSQDNAKVLCTLYKVNQAGTYTGDMYVIVDKDFAIADTVSIIIKNSTYESSDAATFKAAMKNVLLAYEKGE